MSYIISIGTSKHQEKTHILKKEKSSLQQNDKNSQQKRRSKKAQSSHDAGIIPQVRNMHHISQVFRLLQAQNTTLHSQHLGQPE